MKNLSEKNIFQLALIILVSAALLTSCASKNPAVKDSVFRNIDAQKAYQMIEEHRGQTDIVLIDVRTPEEYAAGHIGGAVNIDLFSQTFKDDLSVLDREKTYLIYCQAGTRSAKAFSIMQDMGFQTVYNLFGGMKEWMSGDLPVAR